MFRSQDIVTQANDGEKINYNTIQIDEQLNVSTPQRVVIVHCGLIEGAKGGAGCWTQRTQGVVPCFDSASTSQQENTLLLCLETAGAKICLCKWII